jgi:hypothetical protein
MVVAALVGFDLADASQDGPGEPRASSGRRLVGLEIGRRDVSETRAGWSDRRAEGGAELGAYGSDDGSARRSEQEHHDEYPASDDAGDTKAHGVAAGRTRQQNPTRAEDFCMFMNFNVISLYTSVKHHATNRRLTPDTL